MTRMTEKGVYPASVYDHFLANGYWSKVFTEAAGVTDPAKKIEVIRNSAAAVKISIVQSEKIYDLWQDAREVQQNNAELLAYADKLYTEFLVGDHDPENLIKTAFPQIIGAGNQNPNQPPVTPPPQPGGKEPIIRHQYQCFFSVAEIKGQIAAATYGLKAGVHAAEFINYTTNLKQVLDNESGFCLEEHKGRWFLSCESGSDGKGKVYLIEPDGRLTLVFTSNQNLLLWWKSHTDGHLYVSGCNYQGNVPAGMYRSLTGDPGTWGEYFVNQYQYSPYGQCSKDGNLWSGATSSYAPGWGKNNCRPSIFCNRDMVYTDHTRPNQGFFGRPCVFKGKLYFPGSGPKNARVFRYEGQQTVLEDTSCESCTWLGEDGTYIYALFSNGLVNFNLKDRGKCFRSPSGDPGTWNPFGEFQCQILMSGYFGSKGLLIAGGNNYFIGPADGEIYLP